MVSPGKSVHVIWPRPSCLTASPVTGRPGLAGERGAHRLESDRRVAWRRDKTPYPFAAVTQVHNVDVMTEDDSRLLMEARRGDERSFVSDRKSTRLNSSH